MGPIPVDERPSDDPFYIQASSLAADRPKLVLKHNDAFLVTDSRGTARTFPRASSGSTWPAPDFWVGWSW
jgi:hypothetical protein